MNVYNCRRGGIKSLPANLTGDVYLYCELFLCSTLDLSDHGMAVYSHKSWEDKDGGFGEYFDSFMFFLWDFFNSSRSIILLAIFSLQNIDPWSSYVPVAPTQPLQVGN